MCIKTQFRGRMLRSLLTGSKTKGKAGSPIEPTFLGNALGKQNLTRMSAIVALVGVICLKTVAAQENTAGGVVIGDNLGGIIDRVWVTAPPNTPYILELTAGTFLDCGAGQLSRTVDRSGRDEALLRCGVSVTEIIVLPDIGRPAMLTVHY